MGGVGAGNQRLGRHVSRIHTGTIVWANTQLAVKPEEGEEKTTGQWY